VQLIGEIAGNVLFLNRTESLIFVNYHEIEPEGFISEGDDSSGIVVQVWIGDCVNIEPGRRDGCEGVFCDTKSFTDIPGILLKSVG
jgi:hypothetical protein